MTADIIDVRDIIERVQELERDRDTFDQMKESESDDRGTNTPSSAEELDSLTSVLEELKGCGGDEQWRGDWYPITLIRYDYFEDYARELAEDIGAIDRDAQWPNNHIDWEAAARELEQDYSVVTIGEIDYLFR